MIIYYLSYVIICGLGFMCVCIYYSPHIIQVYFIFSFGVLSYFPLTPCLVMISYMFIK